MTDVETEHVHSFSSTGICKCGAFIVPAGTQILPPEPEKVNCFRGVRGYFSHPLGQVCKNKIEKGQMPPYCQWCQQDIEVYDKSMGLVGREITGVKFHWYGVEIHTKGGPTLNFVVDNMEGDEDIVWRVE